MAKTDEKFIPELNIITLGHVDHGKTTLTQALSGKWTASHSEEIKRGITLRLGYADVTVYYCEKCGRYTTVPKDPVCMEECKPVRTFSIVDAPGHESLMATVLSGSAIADGCIFVIAANEPCPQPQTKEHLAVLDIVGIKNVVIVQNKIDLVTKEQAEENYRQIKEFVKGTVAEKAPIIPVSAQQGVNIHYLLEAIEKYIPTPKRDLEAEPKFYAVRSFDVNKPGEDIKNLKGGILGGSVVRGKLEVGDEIEIAPGIPLNGKYKSIKTKILGIQKAGKNLDVATAGGLTGIMTSLDPSLTRADFLSGQVVGIPGNLPPAKYEISFVPHVMERESTEGLTQIKVGEPLLITVGVMKTIGVVTKYSEKEVSVKLKIPVSAEPGDKISYSKRIGSKWKLIGWGEYL